MKLYFILWWRCHGTPQINYLYMYKNTDVLFSDIDDLNDVTSDDVVMS